MSTDPHANPVPDAPPATRAALEPYLGTFTNFERERRLPTDRRSLGPERCRALLARLDLGRAGPDRSGALRRVVQVAGSKGKGSTVLWMEALVRGRGETVTATLSPHLERLEERIRVDGAPVSPERLVATIASLHGAVRATAEETPELVPTFFDLMTGAVVRAAVDADAAWLLLEVGLGGPLDSTSAVEHDVGVLTTVDLDHQLQLGPTLVAIAGEKARIARPDAPFLVLADPGQDRAALAAALTVGRERGARVRAVPLDPRVPTTVGPPQDANLSMALAALEAAGAARFRAEEVAAAARGIALPARLELLTGPPPLLLDGAHTPRSVQRFLACFRAWRKERPAAILTGSLADRDWRSVLAPLLSEPDVSWIATDDSSPRALDRSELAAHIAASGARVETLALPEAVARLAELAPRALAVTGSLRLAGAVRALWPGARTGS